MDTFILIKRGTNRNAVQMRGPFQEPDPRSNFFRIPGRRQTLLGTAAAIGGAFIKSLLPRRTQNSFRIRTPTRARLGNYAINAALSQTPTQKALQAQTYPFSAPRFKRRTQTRFHKKAPFVSKYRKFPRTRRRHFSRSPNLDPLVLYKSRNRRFQFRRKYRLSKRRQYQRTFLRYYK